MSRKQPNPPPPAGAVKPPPPPSPPPINELGQPLRVFLPVADPSGGFGRVAAIPILANHDPDDFVGAIRYTDDGRCIATFAPRRVDVEALGNIGGGWRVTKYDHEGPNDEYVREAELLCFSTVTAREGTMSAAKSKVELGDRVRDRVTGFTGIATAKTEWLNGCERIGVQPEALHEGKPIEAQWYDSPQLDVLESQVHVPFSAQASPAAAAPAAAPVRAARGGPQNDPSSRRSGE